MLEGSTRAVQLFCKPFSDGSSSLLLRLPSGDRTESRKGFGDTRLCQQSEGVTTPHAFTGADCRLPITWFAPMLLGNTPAALASLLLVTDHGIDVHNGHQSRQITYNIQSQQTGKDLITGLVAAGSQVSVFYSADTLLPLEVQYCKHSPTNISLCIPVRVEYSDYRAIRGIPLPFHISEYVNNSLQLALNFDNVSPQ